MQSNAGMTVGRVHLNSLKTEAYAQCFRAIFNGVSKYHPSFSVGTTLVGILMDWSDQQYNGLEEVVGEDVAKLVVKGCQVCSGERKLKLHGAHINPRLQYLISLLTYIGFQESGTTEGKVPKKQVMNFIQSVARASLIIISSCRKIGG